MAFSLDSPGFRDSLVILGGAGLVIPAFARFRVSPVIGFILLGVLAGPSGLGALAADHHWLALLTISDRSTIEPFAELGIILLLFSIGLELSFRRLWSMRRLVFGLGSGELLVSALVIAAALIALGEPPGAAIDIGLALALSSTALVLPMTGAHGAVGTPVFAMLLFEDLALVPIIFFLGALGPNSAGLHMLLVTALIGLATVAVMMVAGRFALPPLFAQAARTKNPELFLAISLLTVILASLATTAAGLSPIVGALVAGLLIAETEYRAEVELTTAPLRGLALGVFLITVGMNLDLSVIAAGWPQLLLALAGVIVAKAIVTGLLLRVAGGRWAVASEAGLLMASPSETTLIVLGAAAGAELIPQGTATFWQIVTAIGMTITPALAWTGRWVARRVAHRELDAASEPEPAVAGRTVIVGFGRVGRLVAQMLSQHGRPYLAVEADIDVVRGARAAGEPILFGDVARAALIDRLALEHASALVLTMDDPVQAVRLTQRVRDRFPDLTIVARARDAGHAAELYRAGATDAVPETLEASLQLSEAVLVDLGVAMGPLIASIHEKRAEKRAEIMTLGQLDRAPRLRTTIRHEIEEKSA
jgi:CPA2 family monovalent cation:H+ antiporter-2